MVTNIKTANIHPHPKNPRRELGDLSGLADSVKAAGVMQNLTVVPWNDANPGEGIAGEAFESHYTVVIGHRRLEAAKLAGLLEVPCAVAEMGVAEQVAAMLAENVQRSDLSLLEQADGLQMLMDLGEDLAGAAKKTGLTLGAVKSRLNIVKKLRREGLEAVQGRPINLADYEKLYKIKDDEERNLALKKIGTKDFDWAVQHAVDRQERDDARAKFVAAVSKLAKEGTLEGHRAASETLIFFTFGDGPLGEAADFIMAGGGEPRYCEVGSHVAIYKEGHESGGGNGAVKEKEEERDKKKAAQACADELFSRAYKLRLGFSKGFKAGPGTAAAVEEMAAAALFSEGLFDKKVMGDLIGSTIKQSWEDNGESFKKAVTDAFEANGGRRSDMLFFGAYCRLEGVRQSCFVGGRHYINSDLESLYGHLEKLGYEMSGEEKALLDGTHEIYGEAGER